MNTLEKYNQQHLLKYFNELTLDQKSYLNQQINDISFELIQNIFKHREYKIDEKNTVLSPLTPIELRVEEKKLYFNKGLEMIKNKEVAVILMAGGQGTRLGHNGPKGTFDIGLPTKQSLFHLQCDKLLRLYDLTNTFIPWYIMTSDDNHDETMTHFKSHNYFGYDSEYIHFFKQDQLPLVLDNGKIALKSPYEVNLAANGNGGVFTSIKTQGLLDEMRTNDIQYVFLYGIDNVLAKVADPIFFAFAKVQNHDIVSKAVNKISPEEPVGLMCYKNGKPGIVEYSEMSEILKNQRDDKNQLVYRNANILSHVFKLEFLEKCSNLDIPYHAAHKKVGYYENNRFIEPIVPNGYKFELFMFDVFQYADDMSVLTVDREEEFAPVKNKTGPDSPETAKNMVYELHKKWLASNEFSTEYDSFIHFRKTYYGEK